MEENEFRKEAYKKHKSSQNEKSAIVPPPQIFATSLNLKLVKRIKQTSLSSLHFLNLKKNSKFKASS